ncbi:MAG: hypothetical protein QUS66_02425 [Bacteroidota bacterium]|nr:hypothetical protein [Bacteroidota bacterium]
MPSGPVYMGIFEGQPLMTGPITSAITLMFTIEEYADPHNPTLTTARYCHAPATVSISLNELSALFGIFTQSISAASFFCHPMIFPVNPVNVNVTELFRHSGVRDTVAVPPTGVFGYIVSTAGEAALSQPLMV